MVQDSRASPACYFCFPDIANAKAFSFFFSACVGPFFSTVSPLAAAAAFFASAASCFFRMISAVLSADLIVEFWVAPAFLLAARSRSRSRWLPRVMTKLEDNPYGAREGSDRSLTA
eukprot:TRINITY_DN74480_c0_g1_i1.p1 TRINITY_DN74480_c0_g1~~TRINITY_DN74480_c0_g1_i1.p1  ORF type:complete len:116 (+),score=24.50 TRINITY_DN74480_c0_g1_i1:180-527(+)